MELEGGAMVVVGRPFGETCSGPADCESGLCFATDTGVEGICTVACDPTNQCPDDSWACQQTTALGEVCVPVEPKLEPNSKGKDEVCWESIECKTGLKCNNKQKYIKGICEEGGVKKIDTEKGGKCGADVECKDDLVCNGSYFKKIVGKGICGDLEGDGADNSAKKTIENKNKISNKSGFVGDS